MNGTGIRLERFLEHIRTGIKWFVGVTIREYEISKIMAAEESRFVLAGESRLRILLQTWAKHLEERLSTALITTGIIAKGIAVGLLEKNKERINALQKTLSSLKGKRLKNGLKKQGLSMSRFMRESIGMDGHLQKLFL